MVVRLPVAFALLYATIAGSDVGFHPDEGTDACLVCFFLEFPRAMHVAMVSDGQSGLLEFESPPDQLIDSIGAVEERIFRVTVEMNEGHNLKITSDGRRDAVAFCARFVVPGIRAPGSGERTTEPGVRLSGLERNCSVDSVATNVCQHDRRTGGWDPLHRGDARSADGAKSFN